MKTRYLLAVFLLGCVILLAAFGIGWVDWWKLANRIGIVQVLMGALGVAVMLLVITGILSRGKQRWTALIMVAVLLLGFSALTLFSVGILGAPVALLLLGFSIWKRLQSRS